MNRRSWATDRSPAMLAAELVTAEHWFKQHAESVEYSLDLERLDGLPVKLVTVMYDRMGLAVDFKSTHTRTAAFLNYLCECGGRLAARSSLQMNAAPTREARCVRCKTEYPWMESRETSFLWENVGTADHEASAVAFVEAWLTQDQNPLEALLATQHFLDTVRYLLHANLECNSW